ncbi:hypothetical protein BDZ89DRAFT_1072481 [Hymenopellis radicata]|nr:hypothetical protein BDZ89DRAFT_1072481 [Hymenopellis radicata]
MAVGPAATIRQDILMVALESLFYGFYCIIMFQATYLLLNGGLKSRGRKIFLVATLVMFAAATTQEGLQLAYVFKTLPYDSNPALMPPASLTHERNNIQTAFNSLSRLAFLFSDGIVVWRAWVLWGGNRKVVTYLCSMYFVTVALEAFDLGFGIHQQLSGKVVNDQSFTANVHRGLILPLVIPTLVLNASATALIAYKAWQHRRDIRMHVVDGKTKASTAEKILTLFIESGMFYCLVWAIYLMGAAGLFDGKVGYNIMAAVIAQVSGIYPTVIIVLVCLQRTHCDRHFTYDSGLPTHSLDTYPEFAPKSTTATTVTARTADQSLVLPVVLERAGASQVGTMSQKEESIHSDSEKL